MSELYAVLGIALAAAMLYAVLRSYSPAFALLVSLAAAAAILARLSTAFARLARQLAALYSKADGLALQCLLRAAGILLLTDYLCTLCREAGAGSVAWCVQLAGRCLVLAAAWPMLQQIYSVIWELTA